MAKVWKVLAYTTRGGTELDDAMHLALAEPEGGFQPLHCGTAVLFPKAELEQGGPSGRTKVLRAPFLFRTEEGGFGVAAERRDVGGAPEPGEEHRVLLFDSPDLTEFTELGRPAAAPAGETALRPRCVWQPGRGEYELSCETPDGRVFLCYSEDLTQFTTPVEGVRDPDESPAGLPAQWEAGSVLSVTAAEAKVLRDRLNPLTAEAVELPETLRLRPGETLPETVAVRYSDGSRAFLPVDWAATDLSRPGVYPVTGAVRRQAWPFPFLADRADPMICRVGERYYFMATDDENGQTTLKIRGADSIQALASAPEHIIFTANPTGEMSGCIWAPELHEVAGRCYVFFAAGNPQWYTVQSYVLPCLGGDLLSAESWGAPRRVCRPDGGVLNERGITLDMTAFTVEDETYVVWAQRMISPEGETGEHGTSDLMIARTDPSAPWQLQSDPVCICRPRYGWDRIDATVDEGPFLLRRGEDLFLTFSGSSVSVLYCVGLLQARVGDDLLDPASWRELSRPILKSENVPGQFGPGHNAYTTDEWGRDLLVFHAKTPPEAGIDPGMTNRHAGLRPVHWDAAGLPRLDMTPERELPAGMERVALTVLVEE